MMNLTKSDMKFWPLLWAHLTHRETRWSNLLIVAAIFAFTLLILITWPIEKQLQVGFGSFAFFAYQLLAPAVSYAAIGMAPDVAKRHLVYAEQAGWMRHLVSFAVYSPIIVIWAYVMFQNLLGAIGLAAFALIVGMLSVAYYKRRALNRPKTHQQ